MSAFKDLIRLHDNDRTAHEMEEGTRYPATCPVARIRWALDEESFNGLYDALTEYRELLAHKIFGAEVKHQEVKVFIGNEQVVRWNYKWMDADIPTVVEVIPPDALERQRYIKKHRSAEVWDNTYATVNPMDDIYWETSLYLSIPAFINQWEKVRVITIDSGYHERILTVEDLTYGGMMPIGAYEAGEYKLRGYRVPYLSWLDAALLEVYLREYTVYGLFQAIYSSPLYPYRYLKCRYCPFFPDTCFGLFPSFRECPDSVDVAHFEALTAFENPELHQRYFEMDKEHTVPEIRANDVCGTPIPFEFWGEMLSTIDKKYRRYHYIEEPKRTKVRDIPYILGNDLVEMSVQALRARGEKKEMLLEKYGREMQRIIRKNVRFSARKVII